MISRTFFALALLAASALADDDGCSCYLVNSTANNGQSGTESFQQYVFTNFGEAFLGASEYPAMPPLVKNANGNPHKTTNPFFNQTDFTSMWSLAAGNAENAYNDNGKDTLFNTAQNAYLVPINGSTNATMLRLRTSRVAHDDDDWTTMTSGAALVSQQEVLYASFRMRARMNSTVGGAAAGLYMHRNAANGSALELLTRTLNTDARVSLQMQPQNGTGTPLPHGGQWDTDFHTYRLDWTPTAVSAWIDDVLVVVRAATDTDQDVTIPADPTTLTLALGTDTGDWTGAILDSMSRGPAATLDVQWLEVAYNTSTPAGTANCGADATFCSVDAELAPGRPRGGAEPSSMAARSVRIGCAWLAVGLAAVMLSL